MRRILLTALLGATALVPATGFAQDQSDCDRLVAYLEENEGAQLPIDIEQARELQSQQDAEACAQAFQQIEAAAEQPAQEGEQQAGQQQEGEEGAEIVVQQPAPTVTVDQTAPQISVQQPQPNVTVRQPQPEIIVRQPAPVVTIDIPQPEIIVRMPQPEVSVSQEQPQVSVQQPQPEVQVVQPEQPEVQVEEGGQAQVSLTEQGQAQVQVEQVGEAAVTYEQAEPQVTINQAEGEPQIQIEQMEGGGQAGEEQAAGLRDSEDPNQAPEEQEGQQQAAAGQGQDSEDPNQTPEMQEGQQQATATQTGEQAQAGGEGQMQSIAVSDLQGMQVFTERGEQAGEVSGLVQSTADNKMYVVIDHGGLLGLGEKTVALSLEGLLLQGDRIIVPSLTDEEIEALPEFEASEQFPEVEEGAEAQIRVAAQ